MLASALLHSRVAWAAVFAVVSTAMGPLLAAEIRLAFLPCRSVELDETIDMLAQAQRVLAHEALGATGVARLQRGHDLLVVDDRALGPVLLGNGALANGAHVEEEPVGDLDDQRT